MNKIMQRLILGLILIVGAAQAALAQETACTIEDRACVIAALGAEADKIDNPSWRDQTYRELAKTLAYEKRYDDAIGVLDKIQNPDTKALTIRGIGMSAADVGLSPDEAKALFTRLREYSNTIEHPPSFAIALTYIAMSQAFAGDDEGAWATAREMENEALRHKAFGETAEIQAEQGRLEASMKSIGYIESAAYRNKSYSIISKILADDGRLAEALKAAQAVTNSYKKSDAYQYVLDKQKPRDVAKP